MSDRPVRVLHLVKGLGPGGAERLLVSLAEVADRRAAVHEAAYLLPWKQHLVPELEALDVPTHLLAGKRGLADPAWPFRLRQLAGRADVVHLHSPAVAAVARPILRTMRHRPAVVSTEHNTWSSYGPLTRVANAATLPFDDARLAVSPQVRASAWRPWRGSTEVVLHGVPLARLRAATGDRAAARAALGWEEDDVVVVTVANLRVAKDHPTLFAAAAQALAVEPRLRFLAIGQGPLEAELREQLAGLGLGNRFVLHGYHPDPAAVLRGADVFTLSSTEEGLPISLLEAMALGVAPVVTAVGGVPAVLTDGADGVLVPPGTPGALAEAYVRLARDQELRERLAAGASRRAEDFDITRAARALEEVYREVTAGRTGSGQPQG